MTKETQHSLFEPQGCILVGNSLPTKPNRWGSCFSGPGPLEDYERDHYKYGKEVDHKSRNGSPNDLGAQEFCNPDVTYALLDQS